MTPHRVGRFFPTETVFPVVDVRNHPEPPISAVEDTSAPRTEACLDGERARRPSGGLTGGGGRSDEECTPPPTLTSCHIHSTWMVRYSMIQRYTHGANGAQ